MLLWVGCIAGALDENDYRSKLVEAGFQNIDVEPTRVYRAAEAKDILAAEGLDVNVVASEIDGKFMSAFVRAVKPAGACCGPTCCN